MPRIFISYRRDDSGYIAGMLAERLEDVFGADSVFIDVDAIPLGVDFREYLNQAVAKSDLMLALMGNDWLHVKNTQGLRRLDDPADFVRIEIEAALKQQIPVIPVLLEQARMPLEAELPPSLQPLAFRNATEIRSGRDLNYHIEQLIRGLKTHYARHQKPSAEPHPPSVATGQSSVNQEHPAEGLAAPPAANTELPPINLAKWLLRFAGAALSLALIIWGLNALLGSKSDETQYPPAGLSYNPTVLISPTPATIERIDPATNQPLEPPLKNNETKDYPADNKGRAAD